MEIVRLDNLKKNYKDVEAVKGVSFSINEGETFGMLGVNGAGKTTIIKMLTGLAKKSDGNAYVNGISIDEIDKIKKIVDVSPQETSVAQNLTVKENLEFFSNLYETNDPEYMKYVIDKFSLKEVLNRKAKTLSGGWQRRLSIALGLISKPKVLFLDEPTLGLDVLARRELWKIITELKGKTTIVITSHYLEEIESLCDRVAIMSKGEVLATGTIEEIKEATMEQSFEEAFVKIVGGDINEEY